MNPTEEWTAQRMRNLLYDAPGIEYMIHDRDAIFSELVAQALIRTGVMPLSPPRSPKADSFCERVIGTMRRECLDWLIPINDTQLRRIVTEWKDHDNRGRPHMSMGRDW